MLFGYDDRERTGMERRAASHTEEEEMNQRRRLLNAAKKGDQKAVAKLFELYQVRVYNSEMVNKLNRAAGTHKLRSKGAQAKPAKGAAVSKKSLAKPQGRAGAKISHATKGKHSTSQKAAAKRHKK
jgi:hypothetical protein